MNGQQIALVDDTDTAIEATYFVHNDHLGTPQKITDSSQVVVWAGSYEPFGEIEKTVDFIENNVRFPGQYEDGENGLHYNYFRDYDPSLGRYVESDPVGLEGGMNTFAYTWNNPIGLIDKFGKQAGLVNDLLQQFNQSVQDRCDTRLRGQLNTIATTINIAARGKGECRQVKYQIWAHFQDDVTGCIDQLQLIMNWGPVVFPDNGWVLLIRDEV